MTAPSLPVQPIDLAAAKAQVDAVLRSFLEAKSQAVAARALPDDVTRSLRDFLHAGGKRLRPMLCVIGWHAAGGDGRTAAVVQAAAALEMFHAFALIHDDIIDRSATRRGKPTVHRALAARHPGTDRQQSSTWLGIGGAILTGDMALAWSDELLNSADLAPAPRAEAHRLIDEMREEVIHGQYLDLLAPLGPAADPDAALRVIHYKTAKYTCERPLQLGAVLAGSDDRLRAALSRFALPLGEAFQLRDDLLGVYGDPQHTGKPVLDDLREGKPTVLLALATQRADPGQREILHRWVGDPGLDREGAAHIRAVLEATGARSTVEGLISARHAQALAALDSAAYPPAVNAVLRRIAAQAVERTS